MFDIKEDYNITGSTGRLEVWKRGVALMLQNPILGVGAGTFISAEGQTHIDVGGKWSTAHNSFIQIGAELGIGGLVLFIILIWYSIQSLRRMRKKVNDLKGNAWLLDALEISFYGYIITGSFLSQAYSVVLYFIIAYCVILKKLELQSERDWASGASYAGINK